MVQLSPQQEACVVLGLRDSEMALLSGGVVFTQTPSQQYVQWVSYSSR